MIFGSYFYELVESFQKYSHVKDIPYLILFIIILIIPFIIVVVLCILYVFKRSDRGNLQWDAKRRREYADALALCRIGESYLNKGIYSKAIETEKRAISLDPNLAHAHKILGKSYWKSGRVQEAISSLERSLTIQQDQADVNVELGICYSSLEMYDIAKVYFDTALNFNPNYDEAYYLKAKLLGDIYGDFEGAEKLLKKYLSLVPLSKKSDEAKRLIRDYSRRKSY
ncbi:MAG: tetratricopeptide repeat protein [Candidatus Auribacterota bacterium]|jgi:tetratricopeptide (TPR) repeat protein|uniref:Uncharacterized protein n=1 Tax=Candidatus Auribacter fodinae TaxID=2093366 RepID=A0A3A4R1S8_9BACT|nr:MAG: hypothetical protein C4541_08090 [Candidatus Auribacter fodinae]